MSRAYYSATLGDFLQASSHDILGQLLKHTQFDVTLGQRQAWATQIQVLAQALLPWRDGGAVHFEYTLPRLGRRIDNVVIIGPLVFVIEFKVGESHAERADRDQVWDYALDLKNFHDASHDLPIIPILVPTRMTPQTVPELRLAADQVAEPLVVAADQLQEVMGHCLAAVVGGRTISASCWLSGRYQPTPTIIEAASALYAGHGVAEISRSGADADNLSVTSVALDGLIRQAREQGEKYLCLVTGVPGAGKTLVGLNVANQNRDPGSDLYSVFLSGNGPLVDILREALARDQVARDREQGVRTTKSSARRAVESFIQNVHHFRDDGLNDPQAPLEHVTVFDEAQRAWDLEQTRNFMLRKRDLSAFDQSEAEFLLSCMDRHQDWAVVIGLVGGGQEINTGEAGISAWIEAALTRFPQWKLFLPPTLRESEYGTCALLEQAQQPPNVHLLKELHLCASMRAFRASGVSDWVRMMLDLETESACGLLKRIQRDFPVLVTRDLAAAKRWLRQQARGNERVGLVVSSQAQRLKPLAIDVRAPIDPVHWFLDGKDDVRASHFLEDAATEFQVQGLELDWTCVVWDADFRWGPNGWEHWSFVGDRWQHVRKLERQRYLKNAYRVLLTRARQGMVIVVPPGSSEDATRAHALYDPTYQYLRALGLPNLPA